MGELKSCLFCGKRVDQAFEYCPHCGYEFGDEDEHLSAFGPDRLVFDGERSAGDRARGIYRSGAELPALVEEDRAECLPPADDDYLHRLRSLQEALANMERELDRILAREANGASREAR